MFNPNILDAEQKGQFPMAGIHLGDADRFYASGEVSGSHPFLAGGGKFNVGLGGKMQSARIWLGLGIDREYGLSLGLAYRLSSLQ